MVKILYGFDEPKTWNLPTNNILSELMLCVYLLIFTVVPLFPASIPGVERPAGNIREVVIPLYKQRDLIWKQGCVVLADCEKPDRFPEEKSKSFVKKINDRRRLMVQGKQKNGWLPIFLPVGENVVEMVGCLVSLLVLVTLFLDCSRIIPKATQLIQ
ncbi:hypothetical protein Y032_0030g2165 [Ancylostoma ceylanicum]|nr:hypothetical protein Y032_0030g2165 [Ancylostoma ceylanicum]